MRRVIPIKSIALATFVQPAIDGGSNEARISERMVELLGIQV